MYDAWATNGLPKFIKQLSLNQLFKLHHRILNIKIHSMKFDILVNLLAQQIDQLDIDEAESSASIAVQLIQALTEARSFNQLGANLQVT